MARDFSARAASPALAKTVLNHGRFTVAIIEPEKACDLIPPPHPAAMLVDELSDLGAVGLAHVRRRGLLCLMNCRRVFAQCDVVLETRTQSPCGSKRQMAV